jgi:formylglycine-generating enzyme required for sulfatase activity
MAGTLKALGFEVIERSDLGRVATYRALRDLAERAAGAVVVVYYAGHGVQIRGRNYPLPTDLKPANAGDVEDNAVPLDDILGLLNGARAKLSVVFVDACRDNPLPPSARDVGRGLAEQARVPRGSMVVYSAGAGEQALDNLGPADKDPNGLFVRELMPELRRPGVALDDAVDAAAERVAAKAQTIGHEQNPAIYKAYRGKYYLIPGDAPVPVPAPAPAFDPRQVDMTAWASAERVDTEAGYRAYLAQFCPGGLFCKLAEAAAARLRVASAPPSPPAPPKPTEDAARKPGDVFRDCAECPEMVVVPAGSFTMGSPPGEEGRSADEGPRHRVTIARPFAVGRLEVTRGQWARFVAATVHETEGGCTVWTDSGWIFEASRSWRDPGFAQTDKHPAVCLSWSDARAYVEWLARETGESYRLLSEAQWEYVARAGTETRRYWGEDGANREGCTFANAADRTAKEQFSGWTTMDCRDGHVFTAPGGSFRANRFGLRDTLGNVSEWVEDCYRENYQDAPSDGLSWVEVDCPRRVVRSGNWYVSPEFLRSANRGSIAPGDRSDIGVSG